MRNPFHAYVAVAVSCAVVLFAVLGYLILTQPQTDGTYVSGTGTIEYIPIEGGFYGIISDDGERYDPMNLEERFQVDGLRIRFEAVICHECAGIHMWGWIVEILDMRRL